MRIAVFIIFVGMLLLLFYGFVRYLLIPFISSSPITDDDDDAGMMTGATVGTGIGSVVAAVVATTYEHHRNTISDPPEERQNDRD